ncbi:sulfatase family protein [Marinifilum flexuosum]|uniref:Putative sulfatase n=1 Tax=Marinifilum flexuosum TaxID=1117708 RepID=A0A419WWI5_9BACT|nr:sulfatase [Marinifilum flexuosum]RKD99795.1 putative sulfatase [Marinifilum flexuosum]
MAKDISRRNFIRNTAAITAGMTLIPQGLLSSCTRKVKKPNLLFIFPDQYRKQAMGFMKQDPVLTPNIDKLANDGVVFSNAVSNHPLCSPYRGMMLTGKYPLSNGVLSNCHSGRTEFGNFLKPDDVCFSDVLSNNGYDAAYVGKWHLDGPTATKKGEAKVWDSYCKPGKHRHGFNFWYSYGADDNHLTPHYWINDAGEDQAQYFKQWSPEHEAEVVEKYLENAGDKFRNDDKPFAMFWAINPPHHPFNLVPEKYKERFEGKTEKDVLNRPNVQYTDNREMGDKGFGDMFVEKRIDQSIDYFSMCEGVDLQIGKILKTLKEQGLDENTIVIFTSDHGEMLGSQGMMHKNIWFSEAYDIPFIIRWPKKIKPGTDDLLMSVPDVMPTLLGLMGMSDDIPSEVEGKDYSGIFRNEKVDRPEAALYFFAKPEDDTEKRRGVKTHTHTYVIAYDNKGEKHHFLYDDVNDPYQMENIYGENTELEQDLTEKLREILIRTNDPFVSYL